MFTGQMKKCIGKAGLDRLLNQFLGGTLGHYPTPMQYQHAIGSLSFVN